jgi:hypothetical protein
MAVTAELLEQAAKALDLAQAPYEYQIQRSVLSYHIGATR